MENCEEIPRNMERYEWIESSDYDGFNTLTANCEYSRSNTENLLLPIQIKLSKKT